MQVFDLDDNVDVDEERHVVIGNRRSILAIRNSSSTSDGLFSDTFDEQVVVHVYILWCCGQSIFLFHRTR